MSHRGGDPSGFLFFKKLFENASNETINFQQPAVTSLTLNRVVGVDPSAILGSARAQRAALDVDLVDAHHHATEGGLLAEYLGRTIALPGSDADVHVTLSGVLGVIQCAGLDGAAGWLARPSDRRRYPHTTAAFARTNGAF